MTRRPDDPEKTDPVADAKGGDNDADEGDGDNADHLLLDEDSDAPNFKPEVQPRRLRIEVLDTAAPTGAAQSYGYGSDCKEA